jgi:hypothetical protein
MVISTSGQVSEEDEIARWQKRRQEHVVPEDGSTEKQTDDET